MKLTEAKLKELINEVLEEGMKTIADLPEGVFITIEQGEFGPAAFYSNRKGKELPQSSPIFGIVSMEKPYKVADLACDNGLMVAFTESTDGFGPLIYDVAMEMATILSGGLVADRLEVSKDALKVWNFYMRRRKDVSKKQLDNEDGELTPDIKVDDCQQASARDHTKKNKKWHDSSLSKIYSKAPTTLKQLEASGKLINKINLKF